MFNTPNKYLITTSYFPHAGDGLKFLDDKVKYVKKIFIPRMKSVKSDKIILFGDINLAPTSLDLAQPNDKKAGNSVPEQKLYKQIIKSLDLIDVWRYFNKDVQEYTFFSHRVKDAQKRNIGWRLDSFLISSKLIKHVKEVKILTKYSGYSDHIPIMMDINITP